MSDSFATPWTLSSSVHGISQARILDGVSISFSRGSFQPRDWTCASCIGRRILYYWATWKIPWKKTVVLKNILSTLRRLISSTYAALSVLDSEHPNTSPVLRLVTQSCLTLCNPMDCSLLGSPVHGDSPGRNTEVLPCPPPGDLPNPGIETRSPTLQADSLPSESPGKLCANLCL